MANDNKKPAGTPMAIDPAKVAEQLQALAKSTEEKKANAEANEKLALSLGLLTKAMEEALKVKKLQTDLDKEQLKLLQSEEDLR